MREDFELMCRKYGRRISLVALTSSYSRNNVVVYSKNVLFEY